MIITGTLIGSIAFGMQGFNAWRNKKNAKKLQELQEQYESKVQKKMSAAAKKQFEKLYKAKCKIAEEEYNAQVQLLKDLHQENLRSIEYLASLDKWPLAVMPLVMRNDSLFINSQDIDANNRRNDIVPVSIILGPCRDKAFQIAIWKKVEEQLAQHFCTYWGAMSSHPIIFYQDAWKDEKDPADGSSFADIHAKIKNVPTIIISPIITRNNSLQLEISHWCVKGLDTDESYVNEIRCSLPEGAHHYEREASYIEQEVPILVTELSEFIGSLIDFMSDHYLWNRYHIAPLLPLLVSKDIISCNKLEEKELYKLYKNILSFSISSCDVNTIIDVKDILHYCLSVDKPFLQQECFNLFVSSLLTRDSSNSTLDEILQENEFSYIFIKNLLCFCKENTNFYRISNLVLHQLKIQLLEQETIEYVKHHFKYNRPWAFNNYKEGKHLPEVYQLVEGIAFNGFERYCNQLRKDLLKSIPKGIGVDKRNWMRPQFRERTLKVFLKRIKKILPELNRRIQIYQNKCIEDLVCNICNQLKKEDVFCSNYNYSKLIAEVSEKLSKFYIKDEDFTLFDFNNEDFYYIGEICMYSDMIVKYWIRYVFLGEDEVKKCLTKSEQADLSNSFNKIIGAAKRTVEAIIEHTLNSGYYYKKKGIDIRYIDTYDTRDDDSSLNKFVERDLLYGNDF